MTAPDGQPRDRKWLGNYGENVAADFLRASGCRILARNFSAPRGGEVDIVARHHKLLLFVEVKTRRANTRIRPLDAVGRDKQHLIERGANAWLRQLHTRDIPWRFDVIEILVADGEKPRVNHVRDAF
ncbi:MAG: YraN family protein [Verrucomicrobiales bacterium]|nr:YraN family protein [Verrucomicrobiota bacterium JB025]